MEDTKGRTSQSHEEVECFEVANCKESSAENAPPKTANSKFVSIVETQAVTGGNATAWPMRGKRKGKSRRPMRSA